MEIRHLIGLLLVLFYSFMLAMVNAEKIKESLPTNYSRNVLYRVCLFVVITTMIHFIKGELLIQPAATFLVIEFGLFWVSYDILLNLFRGLPVGYVGRKSLLGRKLSLYNNDVLSLTAVKICITIICSMVVYLIFELLKWFL